MIWLISYRYRGLSSLNERLVWEHPADTIAVITEHPAQFVLNSMRKYNALQLCPTDEYSRADKIECVYCVVECKEAADVANALALKLEL